MMPTEMREAVWASAYGAAYAEEFRLCWEATMAAPGPSRTERTIELINVARCKDIANAAARSLTEDL